ncbi:unnamed protein product [Brachionus calyciflorus]|uniref:DDE-1 domain-containing protein n=1 Tax=Brachionus calyciflorus TaxID=104777 RepID=A0A814FZP5_9BILA|nr:unnamed protein product [Brachionus calyciflorus]
MTGDLWLKWLKWFDNQLEKDSLLLIDNCPAHFDSNHLKFKFLKIHYLPPNSTSCLQPMDAGIIKTFKSYYRKLLVTHLINQFDKNQEIELINIKKAIYLIDDAWKLIDEGTIRRCCRHSGILPNQFLKDLNIEPEMKNSKNDEFILLLKNLNEINENFDMTVEEYIDSDVSSQTFEIPNDSEILEEVLVNANLKTSNVEENSETEEDLDPEPKYITLKEGEEAMNKCISYFEQFNFVQ